MDVQSAVDARFDAMDAQFDRIKDRIDQLFAAIAIITKTMATKDDLAAIAAELRLMLAGKQDVADALKYQITLILDHVDEQLDERFFNSQLAIELSFETMRSTLGFFIENIDNRFQLFTESLAPTIERFAKIDTMAVGATVL